MPALPETVLRAITVATDPHAGLADFADLARRDAAVTALLLKRAASAACGGAAAEDVGQAVVLLGLRTCGQVAATVALRATLDGHPPDVQERCESVLRHSLFTANVAARLNRHLALGFKGEEYTAGLLHDIGRVVQAIRSPTAAAEADARDGDDPTRRLVFERQAFGQDHTEAGEAFARANGLPDVIRRAVRRHHAPDDEWEYRRLVALVSLADDVSDRLVRTRSLQGFKLNACRGYVVLSELWEAAAHQRFRAVFPDAVREAIRDTRGTLRAFA
jgi:putative nucleotidyltransferase with HDIG domain